MIDDKSEEGKKLFEDIFLQIPDEMYSILCKILANHRNHIDWDAVYYDIVEAYPGYITVETTTAAAVEATLEDFYGLHGFTEYLSGLGHADSDRYTYREITKLLRGFAKWSGGRFSKDEIEEIADASFDVDDDE